MAIFKIFRKLALKLVNRIFFRPLRSPLPLTSQLCEKNIKLYEVTANKLIQMKLSFLVIC